MYVRSPHRKEAGPQRVAPNGSGVTLSPATPYQDTFPATFHHSDAEDLPTLVKATRAAEEAAWDDVAAPPEAKAKSG